MAVAIRSRRRTRFGSNRRVPVSEINVTPMVDVMLVLLVIFMVTAPLLTVGVQVDLPQTRAAVIQGKDEPLAVTVAKDGRVFLQETEIEVDQLGPRLSAITGNNPEARIFVRGDKELAYGRVMEVMGVINAAGFTRVALVTERKEEAGKQKARPGAKKR